MRPAFLDIFFRFLFRCLPFFRPELGLGPVDDQNGFDDYFVVFDDDIQIVAFPQLHLLYDVAGQRYLRPAP
jgi:hypothetical protein